MFRTKNKNTQRVLNECQLMGCYNVMLKIQYENRLFYWHQCLQLPQKKTFHTLNCSLSSHQIIDLASKYWFLTQLRKNTQIYCVIVYLELKPPDRYTEYSLDLNLILGFRAYTTINLLSALLFNCCYCWCGESVSLCYHFFICLFVLLMQKNLSEHFSD